MPHGTRRVIIPAVSPATNRHRGLINGVPLQRCVHEKPLLHRGVTPDREGENHATRRDDYGKPHSHHGYLIVTVGTFTAVAVSETDVTDSGERSDRVATSTRGASAQRGRHQATTTAPNVTGEKPTIDRALATPRDSTRGDSGKPI